MFTYSTWYLYFYFQIMYNTYYLYIYSITYDCKYSICLDSRHSAAMQPVAVHATAAAAISATR